MTSNDVRIAVAPLDEYVPLFISSDTGSIRYRQQAFVDMRKIIVLGLILGIIIAYGAYLIVIYSTGHKSSVKEVIIVG